MRRRRFTARDQAIWEHWSDPTGHVECWYCGRAVLGPDATADVLPELEHQQPLCRGGADHPNNIVPACQDCNRAKGRLTLEEYREVVFRRRLVTLADAFEVLQELDSDAGGPVTSRWIIPLVTRFSEPVATPKRLYLGDWIADIATWKRKEGPRSVRFSGENLSPLDAEIDAEIETASIRTDETLQ